MGCCASSRDELQVNKINDPVEEVIDILKFSNLKSCDIEREFFPYQYSIFVPVKEAMQCFSNLGLDYSSAEKFLKYFIAPGNNQSSMKFYSARLFITLGIMFGKCELTGKITKMFQNYCMKKEYLDKRDIDSMVSEVIYIHLYAIPHYAIRLHKDDEETARRLTRIMNERDDIAVILSDFFMRSSGSRLSLNEFKRILSDPICLQLFDGSAMRNFALKISTSPTKIDKSEDAFAYLIETRVENENRRID